MYRWALPWIFGLGALATSEDEHIAAVHALASDEDASVDELLSMLDALPQHVDVPALHAETWSTMLHELAARNSVTAMQRVLDRWPKAAQSTVDWGGTLLHEAAEHGSLEVLQLLVQRWPEGVREADTQGRRPLFVAAENGRLEAVRLLWQAWPEPPETFIPHFYLYDYLDCGAVIEIGCNGTAVTPAWEDAAKELHCSYPNRLSKSSLELWLDHCDGYIGWHDTAGTPLVSLLEQKDAKDFLRARTSGSALAVGALQDFRTWLVPIAAILGAYAAVLLEHKLSGKTAHVSAATAQGQFLEGAKSLVSPVFSRHVMLLRLWRWMEVYVAMTWFGFALIAFRWFWWLPLVALAYFGPAIWYGGLKPVLLAPALAMLSKGFTGRLVALLRTLTLLGILSSLAFRILPQTSSVLTQLAWNPGLAEWRTRKVYVWESDYLNEHWMFSWAPEIEAVSLFELLISLTVAIVALYLLICVLWTLLGCVQRACGSSQPDGDPESLLAERSRAVQDLLGTRSAAEIRQVNGKVKPVVAFAWPWRGGGLYGSVALLVLDVALDINTVFAFLAAKHYMFAAVMIFVVARSGIKQLLALPPWRLWQALQASVERGIMHQDMLDYLEEEKRSEAFFCACITAYAFFFAVQTAAQMVVQSASLLLSTYMFAGYAVQACDLQFQLDATDSTQLQADDEPQPDVLGATLDRGNMSHIEVNDSASKLAEVPAASPMVEATLPEVTNEPAPNLGDASLGHLMPGNANILVPAWGSGDVPHIIQKQEHGRKVSESAIVLEIGDEAMPSLPPMPAWGLEATSGPTEGKTSVPARKSKASNARLQKKRPQSSRKPGSSKPSET